VSLIGPIYGASLAIRDHMICVCVYIAWSKVKTDFWNLSVAETICLLWCCVYTDSRRQW